MTSGQHDCIAALDIGNTRLKLGLFVPGERGLPKALRIEACVIESCAQVVSELQRWWSEAGDRRPRMLLAAGSDPDLRDELADSWPLQACTLKLVRSGRDLPVQADVDFPERVGIDRLLNAFAARHWRLGPGPVIVIDSGTATTVDLATSDGVFRGGSILPGLRLSARALHEYTARLPLLEVDDLAGAWPTVPGRNTRDAIRAGLLLGQLGAVRELVQQLSVAAKEMYAENLQPELLVTGGGGRLLSEHLPGARFVDSLALHALAYLGFTDCRGEVQ
ncbi:MAG: Type pantothenate kinase [Planctomycetota bacterium]